MWDAIGWLVGWGYSVFLVVVIAFFVCIVITLGLLRSLIWLKGRVAVSSGGSNWPIMVHWLGALIVSLLAFVLYATVGSMLIGIVAWILLWNTSIALSISVLWAGLIASCVLSTLVAYRASRSVWLSLLSLMLTSASASWFASILSTPIA